MSLRHTLVAVAAVVALASPLPLVAQDTAVARTPLLWPTRPAHAVELLLPSQPLPIGGTTYAHAFVWDEKLGRVRRPVRWTSSDTTVLAIAATGDSAVPIHARRAGRVVVTASSGQATSSAIVYVGRVPPLRRLDVLPRRARLHVGEQIRLLADARDSGGNQMPGTFTFWSWSDSSVVRLVGMPRVAEVILRATAPGTITVFARLRDHVATARVRVDP